MLQGGKAEGNGPEAELLNLLEGGAHKGQAEAGAGGCWGARGTTWLLGREAGACEFYA